MRRLCALPLILALAALSPAAVQEPPAKRTFPDKYEVPKTAAEVWAILDDVEAYAADKRVRGDPPGAMFTALMAVRDVKLVPAAGARLFASKEWMVKGICVIMLAQMDSPESTAALLRFVRNIPTFERAQGDWDKYLTGLGVRDQADQWMFGGAVEGSLKALLARGKFSEIRADLKRFGAVKLMPEAGVPGVELLIEFARASSEGILQSSGDVYWALAKLRRDEYLPLLRAAAADETLPERTRAGALCGLVDGWGAKEYETVLAVAKGAKDRDVRDMAWHYAMKVDSAKTRLELLKLLDGDDWASRRLTIRRIGNCRDPRDVPRLAAILDEAGADDDLRLITLKALWEIEHVRRDIKWRAPRLEKEYLDYVQKNPAPAKDEGK